MNLDRIIGHHRQRRVLETIARSDFVPHAYVFAGPNHIGKKLLAKWFFFQIEYPSSTTADFFSDSRIGRQFREGSHPDLLVVEPEADKSEISIDQVREITRFSAHSPFELSRKFVLVDSAECISPTAINSLLKTLEEPRGKTIFVLTTSQSNKLLKTILSRAVLLSLFPSSTKKLSNELKNLNVNIPTEYEFLIAGRTGLALQFNADKEKAKSISLSSLDLGDFLKTGDYLGSLKFADQIYQSGNLNYIIDSIMLSVRRDILLNPADSEKMVQWIKDLRRVKEIFKETAAQPKLQLEKLLLSFASKK